MFYRAIAIKTAWYWHKNRHEDQWNRIEDLDMNSHSYTHLIFYKAAQNIQWRKDSLLNKCCQENWIFACRKFKTGSHPIINEWGGSCLSNCTIIKSK
jgi:hypothetical protein